MHAYEEGQFAISDERRSHGNWWRTWEATEGALDKTQTYVGCKQQSL